MATIGGAKNFALLTTGVGYINRIREFEPVDGLPTLAVTISALRGVDESVRYTYIDCQVAGRMTHSYIRRLAPNVEQGDKVLVRFRLNGLYATTFTYRQGPKEGQSGVNLKAKLVGIDWARVNGVAVSEFEDVA